MTPHDRADPEPGAGRVALVTGANRGLGLAIAHDLADAGYRVAGTYRTDHPDAAGVHWVRCDVSDPESVDAAFDEIESAVGPVEVLVSNAGTNRDTLVLRMSDEDFTAVIDANLAGGFRVAKRATQKMLRARFGRIIFISSVVGSIGQAGQANYAASKAGVIGFTKTVAAEVARRGVTVNAVVPGLIATDLAEEVLEGDLAKAIPARRIGSAEEVAACIRFLASDDASYVTGTTLTVDGGLSA